MNIKQAEKLKEVLESDVYLPLREYLESKLSELKDIENCPIESFGNASWAVINVCAQKKAYLKLKEILTEIGVAKELEFTGKIDPRDQYHS